MFLRMDGLFFVVLGLLVGGIVAEESTESVLNLEASTNGNMNILSTDIMENKYSDGDIIKETTTTYEVTDGIQLNTNVTNVAMDEAPSVNTKTPFEESTNKFPEKEKEVRVSRNLGYDVPMVTENSILDLSQVKTEINVKEEVNGEILERKPTIEELKILHDDAEFDNLAVEDLANIITVDPDMMQDTGADDLQDMESIFDERKFRNITQNSNKNMKEIKIFFSETEGDYPTDNTEEKETKYQQDSEKPLESNYNVAKTAPYSAVQKNSSRVINDTKKNIEDTEDEIFAIINSIKKSLKDDKLKGFKITAISTKNLPIPTTTPESVTDKKVFEFSIDEITTTESSKPSDVTFKSSKTAPYTTTDNFLVSLTTQPNNIPDITTVMSIDEEVEKVKDKNQKQLYVSLPVINIEEKDGIMINLKDNEDLSPADVENFYNKAISEESYESSVEESKDLDNLEEEKIVSATFADDINVIGSVMRLEDENNREKIVLNKKILNKPASVTIKMGKEDQVIYVPSNAHIKENSNAINITWKSDNSLNNSIVLRLTEYDNHYLIREIQLNVPRDDEVFTQKKAVAIVPTLEDQNSELSRRVVMRDGTFIHFSNVDFLKKNGANREITEPTTAKRLYHVEIASICSACALLAAAALYLVAVKLKVKWFNREKETKDEQETQC